MINLLIYNIIIDSCINNITSKLHNNLSTQRKMSIGDIYKFVTIHTRDQYGDNKYKLLNTYVVDKDDSYVGFTCSNCHYMWLPENSIINYG